MTRWVRMYFDEDDISYVWEVDGDGWVTRSVERDGRAGRVRIASVLAEWIVARDLVDGGVYLYQARYGRLPAIPIDDRSFSHDVIVSSEFERIWVEARAYLEQGPPHAIF